MAITTGWPSCWAEEQAREFLLQHRLFRSHRSGEIIDQKMLMLSYPSRWKYDILRALDYFHFAGVKYDERMRDALDVVIKKRRKDHKWPVQAKHPGQTHFLYGGNRRPQPIVAESGLPTFNFFDFTPIGIVVLATGVLYMVFIGRHLLPVRQTQVTRR